MTSPAIGMFLPMPAPGIGSAHNTAQAARQLEAYGFESAWQSDLLLGRYPTIAAGHVLAAAAAVTTRIKLGYAVQVPALHPLPWLAQELASAQYLSGGRILYGVTPGDGPFERWRGGLRDRAAWHALGIDYDDRAALTDRILDRLPGAVSGEPVSVDAPGKGEFTVGMPAEMPPLLIGGDGGDDAVFARVLRYGASWFPAVMAPSRLAAGAARLRELSDAAGVPMPAITVALPVSLGIAGPTAQQRELTARTIHELYGVPAGEAGQVMVLGSPEAAAERLAEYAEIGIERVVFSVSNEIWDEQFALIAEAARLAG
ncbi:LLM class flavin-dependent oxidoreductase [Yinghuangia soli]|uniref:LLM class flavin-dependent oxidoreductase n=1 Tax=Yinghuangia soli TaxID=2908204 RepID=A0AA41U3J8_9ACTN|nr:LLM class flavin-dependent oxidoreductase [Yinghuangia soli]MCF2531886.1 LLM class flavin-dependent oxidoreductase [Yinghuangia soli]